MIPRSIHPLAAFDDFLMHQRDLAGGPTKADEANFAEKASEITQRNVMLCRHKPSSYFPPRRVRSCNA
jgi:hypothetical protein